ncbi:pseudoazurin [Gammaproteobacteria bacterium]|nr:pseudoazurin [Gammaproteobacteria bacterium]
MKALKIIFLSLITLSALSIISAEYTVKMLNNGKEGLMVFEPSVLSIQQGDTVLFEATDVSHNSASIPGMIPQGAMPWTGAMNQDVKVTFDKEGVYVYQCTPHSMMAMVGVIKVGVPKNLEIIKGKAEDQKKAFVMNKERLTNYLQEI